MNILMLNVHIICVSHRGQILSKCSPFQWGHIHCNWEMIKNVEQRNQLHQKVSVNSGKGPPADKYYGTDQLYTAVTLYCIISYCYYIMVYQRCVSVTHLRLWQVGRVMEIRQHHLKGIIKHLIPKMSVVQHGLRQVPLQKVADRITWIKNNTNTTWWLKTQTNSAYD